MYLTMTADPLLVSPLSWIARGRHVDPNVLEESARSSDVEASLLPVSNDIADEGVGCRSCPPLVTSHAADDGNPEVTAAGSARVREKPVHAAESPFSASSLKRASLHLLARPFGQSEPSTVAPKPSIF